MDNIPDVIPNPLTNATIAQASQIAARNDPTTLAKEFDAEIERAKAAQATSTPPLDMSAGKTEAELLKIDDPNIVLTQAAAQPAPSPQTLPTSPTNPPQTSTDAFNGQKDVNLPPPANDNDPKASPLGIGGRMIRGLGLVGMLVEATRFDAHQINIEGRSDLKATWTFDRVQDTHKLDIADAATGKHLTTLPVENTNGQNWAVKDANGETIGQFQASIEPHSKGAGTLSSKALAAIDQRKNENAPATAAGNDAPTQAPTQPGKPETSPTERNEHGFVTSSAEEASLVGSMIAQGKSQEEIEAALKSLRAGKVGSSSVDQALSNMGVSSKDIDAFLNGGVIPFQYPTDNGADVFGFIQYKDGKLTSQLFSINNTSGGAPAAFRKFVVGSSEIARGLGLKELELQGGSVINHDLAEALRARGFQPKTVAVPDALGGGMQEVLFKIVQVK